MDLTDSTEATNYYDELLDMFIHPGWKRFIQGVQQDYDDHQTTIPFLKTVEQLHRFHGRNYVYRQVLDFEAVIKARLDLLSEGGSLDEPVEAVEDYL